MLVVQSGLLVGGVKIVLSRLAGREPFTDENGYQYKSYLGSTGRLWQFHQIPFYFTFDDNEEYSILKYIHPKSMFNCSSDVEERYSARLKQIEDEEGYGDFEVIQEQLLGEKTERFWNRKRLGN